MGLQNDYLWKMFNAFQQSPILLRKFRTQILRQLGLDIDSTARIAEGVYIGSKKLVMKQHTFVNVGSFIDGNATVTIEDYSRIGPYVKILTGTHEYRRSEIRRFPGDPTVSKPVTIQKGCWIGMGSIILPGITIAKGCVIAAGSVMIKSTEPNGLYAGNPAKRIKDLPTE